MIRAYLRSTVLQVQQKYFTILLYEVLFNEETKEGLEGFEVGHETELGAIDVMTGIYTGRSPKDKFYC